MRRRVTATYISTPTGRGRLGDVYFIACDNRFVKVGFTDDVEMRLPELQVGCPFELEVVGMLRNTTMLAEQWFHGALRAERARGEWFNLTERVRLLIHYVNRGFDPQRAAEVEAFYQAIGSPLLDEIAARYYRPGDTTAQSDPSDALLNTFGRVINPRR